MAKRSEPNAQNSELNPKAHPSGARIEKLIQQAEDGVEGEQGVRGHDLSDAGSSRYISPEDPAEGDRGISTEAPHRMDPNDRESRD